MSREVLASFACVFLVGAPRVSSAVPPEAPRLAVIANLPGDGFSTLHVVELGATVMPPPSASFEHLPRPSLRAVVVPGRGEILVSAERAPLRDRSYAMELLRLRPGTARPVEVLADRLAYAARPLATRDGRVFVMRGRPGAEPDAAAAQAGLLRVDEITVDELLPDGRLREAHRFAGYMAFPAASFGREVILLRVGPSLSGQMVALDPDRGALRVLGLAPFGRDFTVDDRGRLSFQGRAGDRWTIERLDLRTGERSQLTTGSGGEFAPQAWPGGGLAYTPDGGAGLHVLDGDRRPPPAPLGPGWDLVFDLSRDGRWAAISHFAPDGLLPEPAIVSTSDGRAYRLPIRPGVRYEIAGFVDGGGR